MLYKYNNNNNNIIIIIFFLILFKIFKLILIKKILY